MLDATGKFSRREPRTRISGAKYRSALSANSLRWIVVRKRTVAVQRVKNHAEMEYREIPAFGNAPSNVQRERNPLIWGVAPVQQEHYARHHLRHINAFRIATGASGCDLAPDLHQRRDRDGCCCRFRDLLVPRRAGLRQDSYCVDARNRVFAKRGDPDELMAPVKYVGTDYVTPELLAKVT